MQGEPDASASQARKDEGRRLREQKDAKQAELERIAAEAGAIYRSLPNLTHPDAPRGGYGIRGPDVTTTNVTTSWMIKLAYNVHANQISGAPSWIDSERYDTVGRSETPGEPSEEDRRPERRAYKRRDSNRKEGIADAEPESRHQLTRDRHGLHEDAPGAGLEHGPGP